MREREIEDYLTDQVEMSGGLSEKFTSPGRRGVPDRIITWPAHGWARVHFVETKTDVGRLRPEQVRDHARRRRLGSQVFVIRTKDEVNTYVARYRQPPAPL